jgi:hypothetical protein
MITGHKLALLRKLAGNLRPAPYVTTYSYWDDLGQYATQERWEYDGCRSDDRGFKISRPRGKVVERQRVEVRYDWVDQITLWGRAS